MVGARSFGLSVVAACAVLLAACAGEPSRRDMAEPGRPWLSPIDQAHPLVGRIWSRAAGGMIDRPALVAALSKARFILLGEKHDNADHHVMQAWIVRALMARGRRPAVAFEMISSDQENALSRHLAGHPRDASGLGDAVGWTKTGWPAWRHYAPIAQAALDRRLPILAANLSRPAIRAIAGKGVGAPLPKAHLARMRSLIAAAHCDQLPAKMVGRLTAVLSARDAYMAKVLSDGLAREGTDGALLIAGAGHVRDDHGVPWHLKRKSPTATILSVGMIEVTAGQNRPADYAPRYKAASLPFDFVWFTPAHDDEDPCEKFAKALRRLRKGIR